VIGAALAATLLAANLPTPLYQVYEHRFGFSRTVLTLIFATYAVVLIPSLLLFGQLSDRIGRRRPIALGLAVAAVGLALFAVARGTPWLFAARAVQGLAVGIITGTATAAAVELEPRGDRARAAFVASIAQAAGSAASPALAGVLAQWAPDPLVLSYVVGLAVTAALAVAVMRVPEPHPPSGTWRPQLPSVPAGKRAEFARAGLTGACVWGVGALFLSVVPSYAGSLLRTGNLALLGAVASAMLGSACVAQAVCLRAAIAPVVAQAAGLLTLVAGLAALVVAFPTRLLVLLLAAAVLAGTGLGLGTVGAQTDINGLAPQERRGEVTAAYITCVYTGVTVTSVAAGVLSGLVSLFAAVTVVAAVVATVAAADALWHVRARVVHSGR
jgi:MFS family permease